MRPCDLSGLLSSLKPDFHAICFCSTARTYIHVLISVVFCFRSIPFHFISCNMMANPVSFQLGDDVKVVYLRKKPIINNMIGTVVTHVPDQADMVEVVIDRRLYAIHASNLVSIPLIIHEAYRTIALRILSTGRQLASRKGRFSIKP